MNTEAPVSFFSQRKAGVLLHPTSLPCGERHFGESAGQGFGTLGEAAYRFIDFMAEAGLQVWQMLPTGPTQDDLSPYQSPSAHAGNPDLISINWLIDNGWVEASAISASTPGRDHQAHTRQQAGDSFRQYILSDAGAQTAAAFGEFCQAQAYWLDDFALFCALRAEHNMQSWTAWPEPLRKREANALAAATERLAAALAQIAFEQFAFFSQWQALRRYAQQKQVALFGDIPIFVAHDSADVWAEQGAFLLNDDGQPLTVAGVPPDYFSATGQHWGNPHYHWQAMEQNGFQWWLARLKTQLALYDIIRIDHFRGLEAYWAIPGDSCDARTGQWVKAPGEALLQACMAAYPGLPLVAENLGVITPEVEALRQQFSLPGMLVLQFAFDGNNANPHLPHNHTPSDVIYSGTHDNDTSLGWYEQLGQEPRTLLQQYCFNSQASMPELLIDVALASVGKLAMIPLQDFLALGSEARMNMPGTRENNWRWTFTWEQLPRELSANIRQQLHRYQRLWQ